MKKNTFLEVILAFNEKSLNLKKKQKKKQVNDGSSLHNLHVFSSSNNVPTQ